MRDWMGKRRGGMRLKRAPLGAQRCLCPQELDEAEPAPAVGAVAGKEGRYG
jgi:hypothetical protein